MDQSSGRMTSRGRRLDRLASPDEGSKDELLSDTDESSEEYIVLGLEMSLSKPIRIDGVCSLIALLSLDIPTYKWRMKTKIPFHFLRAQTNNQKKKKKEKKKKKKKREKKGKNRKKEKDVDESYLGNGWVTNQRSRGIDEAQNWRLGSGIKMEIFLDNEDNNGMGYL